MNTADRKAEYEEYTVYKLRGLTYVPHYRNKNVYVGLGYGQRNFERYNAAELMLMGAKPDKAHLWVRGEKGIVDAKNP